VAAGISFETKIMEQQKDNPRFSFLRSTDPYHKYYRWKVGPPPMGGEQGGVCGMINDIRHPVKHSLMELG